MKDEINDRLEQLAESRRQAPDSTGIAGDPTQKGVTIAWLAQAFRLAPNTVRSKLATCPVKVERRRGSQMKTTLYDLRTASAYLVTPVQSTADFMKAMKRGDLPPALQQTMWDALLKRQKWEENAGDLWRTSKVRETLSATFQTIKSTMQLWVETIERQTELSSAQRALIVELVDALAQDIYDKMAEEAAGEGFGPQLDELPDLIGEERSVSEVNALLDDEAEIDAMI